MEEAGYLMYPETEVDCVFEAEMPGFRYRNRCGKQIEFISHEGGADWIA